MTLEEFKPRHKCHTVSIFETLMEWVEYTEGEGFELTGQDLEEEQLNYTSIIYCPWCGEKLMTDEEYAKLDETGKRLYGHIRNE
jgi:hypothetical protein